MSERNNKKVIPFFILRYMMENASEEHPVTQTGIAEALTNNWDLPTDRKTVQRTMKWFQDELDYEICSSNKGYWINKEFSDAEIRLLCDAVMSSKYISQAESKELVLKLTDRASCEYRNNLNNIIIMSDDHKHVAEPVFDKLETINESINNHTILSFEYTSWYRDEAKRKARSGKQLKAPVRIVYMDQRYYMVAGETDSNGNLHTDFYAVDKMQNVRSTDPLARPIRLTDADIQAIRDMAARKEPTDIQEINISVLATDLIIHSLESHFGSKIIKKKNSDSGENHFTYQVALKATEDAFMQFLRENMNELKLISPLKLVQCFKDELNSVLKMYE